MIILLILLAIVILSVCFLGMLSWEVIVAFCEQGYSLYVIIFIALCVIVWLIIRDN